MTKKAVEVVKVSDYLKGTENLNIRSMMKDIRAAFKSGALDIAQVNESFKIDKDKGIVKAANGDKGIMYDFLIFDVDGFEDWFNDKKDEHTTGGNNKSSAPIHSAAQLIKLRTENPQEYERIREKQKNAITTYDPATGQNKNNDAFVEAAKLIAEDKLSEAESLLKGLRVRKGGKPFDERERYMKQIQEKRDASRDNAEE